MLFRSLEENDKNLQHLRPLENTTFFNSIKGFALKPLKMQENTQPLKVSYMNSPMTITSIEQHLQNLTSPPPKTIGNINKYGANRITTKNYYKSYTGIFK